MHHKTITRHIPHRRTKTSAAVLAGGLLLFATACGGGDPRTAVGSDTAGGPSAEPSPAAAALDPCAILPTSRLSDLLDARLTQDGPAKEQALAQACTWRFTDPGPVGAGTLSITAWHGDGFFLPGAIGKALRGVGDQAQADPTLGIVLFRVGDEVVQAHVQSPDKRDRAREIAQALANAI